MPEEPVSSTEQMRILPDPGACPANCTEACPVHRRLQRRAGCHSLCNEQVMVLQRLLVALSTLAQIDQMNAERGGFLGHPQVLDQSRRLPAEARLIRWEPLGEYVAGP